MAGRDDLDLVLDSARRRVRAMHSLWLDAVATMDAEQVNHVEREPVLPIAFSLFHLAQIEDGSVTMLGGPPLIYDDELGWQMGLAIRDHGKHRTPAEMVHQRIGDYAAFGEYQRRVFDKTESWLVSLDAKTLGEVVVARPFPLRSPPPTALGWPAPMASHASTASSAGYISTACGTWEG